MGLIKLLETAQQSSSILVNQHQTPPEQIWLLLTPEQQQTVFQILVQVCHHLMSRGHITREVCDEHP